MRLLPPNMLAGCLVSLVGIVLLFFLSIVFESFFFISWSIIVVPFAFSFGRQIIASFSGPDMALWLYTGNVGVSFAFLSIDLFRQDKKFSKEELDKLCGYFASEFGIEVGKIVRKFVIKNKQKKVFTALETRTIADFPHKHRMLFLYNLFSMAMANGQIKQVEEGYLKDVAELIHINDYQFNVIKSKFVKEQYYQSYSYKEQKTGQNKGFSKQFFSSQNAAYLTLELSKFATDEEVKAAYRQLAKTYHPDKQGNVSETTRKVAEQKFKEVTQAYELIKQERGIK